MVPATLVSVEEYLNTSYPDGDKEYIDGEIQERNLGEIRHSDLQTAIAVYLRAHYKRFWTGVEVRVQVQSNRFRVPDVTLVNGSRPDGRIIATPPHVAVEVLSPEDRAGQIQEKIDDYLSFGIPFVWIVNPETRKGYIHTADGSREAKDGILRAVNPDIELPLAEMFESN